MDLMNAQIRQIHPYYWTYLDIAGGAQPGAPSPLRVRGITLPHLELLCATISEDRNHQRQHWFAPLAFIV